MLLSDICLSDLCHVHWAEVENRGLGRPKLAQR